MKKRKLFCIFCLVGLCLVLTGCGNKDVLTCSINQEQSGLSIDQTVQITFRKESVTKVMLTVDCKATTDSVKKDWNSFVKAMDTQFTDHDKNGISLTKKDDKANYTYQIVLDVDIKTVNDEDLEEYDLDGLANVEGTYSDVKKSAEAKGFSCK